MDADGKYGFSDTAALLGGFTLIFVYRAWLAGSLVLGLMLLEKHYNDKKRQKQGPEEA